MKLNEFAEKEMKKYWIRRQNRNEEKNSFVIIFLSENPRDDKKSEKYCG